MISDPYVSLLLSQKSSNCHCCRHVTSWTVNINKYAIPIPVLAFCFAVGLIYEAFELFVISGSNRSLNFHDQVACKNFRLTTRPITHILDYLSSRCLRWPSNGVDRC